MLDIWYFCACTQALPSVVAPYLMATSLLRSPHASHELREIACTELLKAEPILRYRALPEVMQAGLSGLGTETGLTSAARRMLVDTLETIPDGVARGLMATFDALVLEAPLDDTLNALNDALRRARGARQPKPAEPVPYVHLEEYIVEVAALSLCLAAARRSNRFAEGLGADTEVGLLLDHALAEDLGRLCLVLGAELACLVGDTSDDSPGIVGRIMRTRSHKGWWEPDLLRAAAQLRFLVPFRLQAQQHAEIMSEVVTFEWLGTYDLLRAPAIGEVGDRLDRLGLGDVDPELALVLLWQATLWQLATEIDAPATANALEGHWIPQYGEIGKVLRAQVPLVGQALRSWKRRVQLLAGIRMSADRVPELSIKPGEIRANSWLSLVALSPWVTREKLMRGRPYRPYGRADGGAPLLRLLGAVNCAVEILQHPALTNHEPILGLALHGWEVLESTNPKGLHNLNNGVPMGEVLAQLPEDHAARSMPVPMWGLSLFVWRRLKQLGAGESDPIDPGLIADYLLKMDLTPAERNLRTGMRDRCTEWVHDGLTGSLPGSDLRAQGRWRHGASGGPSAAERVLQAVATSELPGRVTKDKAKGLLAIHFGIRQPETVLDLVHADRNLNAWSVHAAEPLALAGWSDEALDSRCRTALSSVNQTGLALALITARMASILRADPIEAAQQAAAIRQWREIVGRLTGKQELSRPQRLAMLWLLRLASAGTQEEIALLEEVVDTELEFGLGTPLDRWTLFAYLGRACALPSGTATALRERMLSGVYAWRTRPARSANLRDPVIVARQRRADALLDRLLAQFLWETRSIDAGFARDLTSTLWRQAVGAPALREFTVDLGEADAQGPWTDLDRRLLVGAAVDPVQDRLRVHAPPRPSLFRTHGGDNVMDGWTFPTAADLRTHLSERSTEGAESRLLGVVAARQDTDVWVNVGLTEPVAGRLSTHVNGHDPQVGDVVLAILRPRSRPGNVFVEIRPYPRFEPVQGEVQDATMQIDYREEVPHVSVTVRGGSGGSFSLDELPERVRQIWLPDIVGLFTGELRPAGRDVVSVPTTARRQGTHWVPADRGAPELFAQLAEDGGQEARLVFAGPVDGERNRYSTAPGSNFVVPHSVWSPQSLGHLTEAIQQLQPSGIGLVIRARVITGQAGNEAGVEPLLELLAGEASLDRRAHEWRHVFEEGSDFTAYRQHEGERFRFDSGVRGFPTVVVSPDHATGTVCRFSPGTWGDAEQRRAAVTGVAGTRRLRLSKASRRRTFEQIHGVDIGDVIVVDRVLSSSAPRDGTLLGWTRENLAVNVEVEALDFAGLDRQPPSSAVSRRRCVVTSVRPLRSRAAEQYVPVPDEKLVTAVSNPANRGAVEDHLLRQRTLEGIIVEAPSDARQPEALFGVWLDLGTTLVSVSLRRSNFRHPPQRVGELVTAERARHDTWAFSAFPRMIRVRPLWAVEERTGVPTPGARFLDAVTWRGGRYMLTQPLASASADAKPTLHLHPLEDGQGLPATHLAMMTAARKTGRQKGIWEEPRQDLRSGTVELYRDLSRNGGRRAGVRIDSPDERSLLFTGEVPTASWNTAITVDYVRMSLVPVTADEFEVNRIFVTSQTQRHGTTTTAREPSVGADEEDVTSGWRAYVRDGRPPVEAELLPGWVRLRTEWKAPTEQGWSHEIPLDPEDEPWVDRAYATDRVRVVLTGSESGVRASYRRVPAMQLGEAMAILRRQGVVLGARSVPQQAMYYVDRRTLPSSPWTTSAWSEDDGTDGQACAQDAGGNVSVVHRFEWGYGWTLQVPETHMTIASRPAGQWPVTPFHGDRVRELQVSRDSDGRYLLDIDTAALEWGWHRHLYNDADNHVVFTAELEPTYDGSGMRRGARIGAVHVRWRREPGGTRGYRDDQRVSLRGLRLSKDAHSFVERMWSTQDRKAESAPHRNNDPRNSSGRERQGAKDTNKSEERTLRKAWLRLNPQTFLDSGGATAEFDIIRPVLGSPHGLQEDDYVFLEADQIEELDNDLQLLLRPGSLLGQAEQQLVVKVRRREYSSRQDLLRQIYYGDGSRRHEAALRGNVYLVRIRGIDTSRKWVGGQIRDGLARSVSVLRGHLLTSDTPTFAMAHRRGSEVSLEVRPNVQFRLTAEDLVGSADLVNGSAVRLALEPTATTGRGRIRITTVLRGDSAFVPHDGRPVVLLPRQDLLDGRFDLAAALKRGHYSVAGLPALSLAASQPGASRGPDGRSLSESIVTTPHPNVVLLTPREPQADAGPQPNRTSQRPRRTPRAPGRGPAWSVAPPDATVRAGTVQIEADGKLTVRALDGSTRRLPWAQLSFLDGSVHELRQHLERAYWQYHDLSTSYRAPQPPHMPVVPPKPLPRKARAVGEPVFFSEGGELRHREDQLARFGFPAGGLLERRTAGGQVRYSVPVAGLSRNHERTAVGIWVEVAPGHLVELLGSMLTTADSGQIPLTSVDWTHLAPGDLITLLVRRGHELEIGSIALQAWAPGPRGAFARRALLPVADVDPGAMTLGAGEWRLTVPAEPDQHVVQPGSFVWFARSGHITPVALGGDDPPASQATLSADSASTADPGSAADQHIDGRSHSGPILRRGDVVLLAQDDDRLQILGAPGLHPVLDDVPQHWAPWLRRILVDEPSALLGPCGGALPVTVQSCDASTVVVSRERQEDRALGRGGSIPVVPLGVVDNAFVLRAGHRLYLRPVREVVPGLPHQHAEAAARLLRREPELLWLTCHENRWTIGLPDEQTPNGGNEIRVRLLGRLGEDASAGVLCWDPAARRPRWLPGTSVGWTALKPEHLDVWVHESEPDGPEAAAAEPARTPHPATAASELPLRRLREVPVALGKNGAVSLTGTKANLQRLGRLRVGDPLCVQLLQRQGHPVDGQVEFLARMYLSEVLLPARLAPDAKVEVLKPRFCEVELRQIVAGRDWAEVRVSDIGRRALSMAVPPGFASPWPEQHLLPVQLSELDHALVDGATCLPEDIPVSAGLCQILADWLTDHAAQLLGPSADLPLPLAPALAAVSVLVRLSAHPQGNEWRGLTAVAQEAAVHACRQLGLRAAVSRHLEPLIDLWPAPGIAADERGRLWSRIPKVKLAPTTTERDIEELLQLHDGLLCRGAAREDGDLLMVMSAVVTSVGAHFDYGIIHDYPGLGRRLSALGRALAPRNKALVSQSALIPAQQLMVKELLRGAVASPWMLLPLPMVLQDEGCLIHADGLRSRLRNQLQRQLGEAETVRVTNI